MKKFTHFIILLTMCAILFSGCMSGNNENIDDVIPEFIDVKDAISVMKSQQMGTDPWQIYYTDTDYIYASYNFGIEFIFRYNIKENIIDRVLDVRCLHKNMSDPSSTNFQFLPDGSYSFFSVGVTGNEKSDVPKGVYKSDFEKQSVILTDIGRENFALPSGEYYQPEEYGVSADKYRAKLNEINENPLLPELYDWSTVAQIDDNIFCIIMPDDPENDIPGEGYHCFKFVIIDIAQNKIIQEYRIDSAE